MIITVHANQAPTAVGQRHAAERARVRSTWSFSSASSADDGTIETYAWTFGDGGTSSLANPSHTYAAGTYTATLTVTDDGGLTDSDTVAITVVIDDDGDGVSPPTDCNDTNAAINPGAARLARRGRHQL